MRTVAHSIDLARPAPAAKPTRVSNVALGLAAVAAVLVVLELGVRTYAYATGRGFSENPSAFISPFFTTEETPAPRLEGHDLVFKENERVTLGKRPDEVRIVCLGGSTTLPAQDAEGLSYARALEERLRSRFPNVQITVLNAGGNGFSTAHTLVNLALRIMEAQPDIVTVYHNVNDLSVNYFGARALSDYANKYSTPHYLGYRHRSGLWSDVERASRLVRIVDNRLGLLRFQHTFDPTRDHRPGLPYFKRNLRSIVALARAHGVDVVLGTEAARASLRTREGFAAYNQTVRQVAAETGVGLADVAEGIVDDTVFVDDVHTTSAGARAVAERWYTPVAAALERRLTTTAGARPPTRIADAPA